MSPPLLRNSETADCSRLCTPSELAFGKSQRRKPPIAPKTLLG